MYSVVDPGRKKCKNILAIEDTPPSTKLQNCAYNRHFPEEYDIGHGRKEVVGRAKIVHPLPKALVIYYARYVYRTNRTLYVHVTPCPR